MKKKIVNFVIGIFFVPIVYLALAFGINIINNSNFQNKNITSENNNLENSTLKIDFSKAQNLELPVKGEEFKNLYFNDSNKLSTILLARRITYEIPYPDSNANFGFCYKKTSGEFIEDGGRTVLFNKKSNNPQRELICSGIIENLQHSDLRATIYDREFWNLKPNVKADITGLPDNTPIFDVVPVNYKGEEIQNDKFTIYAINFKKSNRTLTGYTDRFYEFCIQIKIMACGDDSEIGLNYGRKNANNNINDCKVDFRIYWYGTADFWFDKLTVDDMYADKLLDSVSGFNFDENMFNELSNLERRSEYSLKPLYLEKITYSQIPCTDYLIDKIDLYNNKNGTNIKYNINKTGLENNGLRKSITLEIVSN